MVLDKPYKVCYNGVSNLNNVVLKNRPILNKKETIMHIKLTKKHERYMQAFILVMCFALFFALPIIGKVKTVYAETYRVIYAHRPPRPVHRVIDVQSQYENDDEASDVSLPQITPYRETLQMAIIEPEIDDEIVSSTVINTDSELEKAMEISYILESSVDNCR